MFSAILPLLLVPVFQEPAEPAELVVAAGTQLSYRGTVELAQEDPTLASRKSFTLSVVIGPTDDAGGKVYWQTTESGHGGWHWVEQFGRMDVDTRWHPAAGDGPSLLYARREENKGIDVLLPLLVLPEGAKAGVKWTVGNTTYEVAQSEKIGQREAWPVVVSNNSGHLRTLWVDTQLPLIVKLEERLVMGLGIPYVLEMELADHRQLVESELQPLTGGLDALVALRSRLERSSRSEKRTWNDRQREILAKELPALEKQLASVPVLAKIVRSARGDLLENSAQAAGVAELVKMHTGQPAPKFELAGLGGSGLSADDLPGQVTVLHFWDYKDTPLKQPYGQVGYLDFLYHRHKAQGVKVHGVAVNADLAKPEGRAAAVRSATKLRKFMNLGYPILLDAGDVLKRFGDPRPLGAELPLWVVVGRNGRVAHYHVGHYPVDRAVGLKALEEIIVAELAKK